MELSGILTVQAVCVSCLSLAFLRVTHSLFGNRIALYREQWMRRRNYCVHLVYRNPNPVGIDIEIVWGGRPCSFTP